MENVQLVKVIICEDLHSTKQWKVVFSSSLSPSVSKLNKFQKQETPETDLCILLNYN